MKLSNNLLKIVLLSAVILGLYFLVVTVKDRQNKQILATISDKVAAEEVSLSKLADLTRSNGTDEVTSRVIVDCKTEERQKFDVLLDKLSAQISSAELTELSSLFSKCGSFFADRKSVMAVKLVREVDVYADYVDLKNSLKDNSEEQKARLASWSSLAQSELKSAEYFNTLVGLQNEIINQLLNGKNSNSDEVKSILSSVASTKGQMIVLSQQIENIRKDELNI